MGKRRFKIKGTKDFLVMAVFLGILCVWAIRDAWFPTRKLLEKYPLEVAASFEVPGVVQDVPVSPNDKVEGKKILAVLNDQMYRERVDRAAAEFNAARESRDPAAEEKLLALTEARAELEKCVLRTSDISMGTSHGEEPLRGTVLRIVSAPGTAVEPGDPVVLIQPYNTFYIFNKTLAVFSFIGMIIFLVFHWIASR